MSHMEGDSSNITVVQSVTHTLGGAGNKAKA